MPSLSELQRGFAAAIIFGDRSVMRGLGIVGDSIDPADRIAIYRNNVLANYRKALAATYPVVQALVGRAFFGAAVEVFVRAHPSRRGDINRYGGELAEFLQIRDSTVSQHLALLRQDGLVIARRNAQTIWYSISSAPARAVIKALHQSYCGSAAVRDPDKPIRSIRR